MVKEAMSPFRLEPEASAYVRIAFTCQPRLDKPSRRFAQRLQALPQRVQAFLIDQQFLRSPQAGFGQCPTVFQPLHLSPPTPVDQVVSRDLIEPGAEVSTVKAARQMLPDALPHFLVDIFEVRLANACGEESEQLPGVTLIQPTTCTPRRLHRLLRFHPQGDALGQGFVRFRGFRLCPCHDGRVSGSLGPVSRGFGKDNARRRGFFT